MSITKFTNASGVVQDLTDTKTIYAERLNEIIDHLEELEKEKKYFVKDSGGIMQGAKYEKNLTSDNILIIPSSEYSTSFYGRYAFRSVTDWLGNSVVSWIPTGNDTNPNLKIDFGVNKSKRVWAWIAANKRDAWNGAEFAKRHILEGSNDNTNWTILDDTRDQAKEFFFTPNFRELTTPSAAYRYLRIRCIRGNGNFGLNSVEFFEYKPVILEA